MAKTAKAAAPKKKLAPAPKSAPKNVVMAKKAPAKKTVTAKAPAKAAKAPAAKAGAKSAAKATAKPVAKAAPAAKVAAGAKGKAPAKAAAPAKPVAVKAAPAAAVAKPGKTAAKPVKPTAVKAPAQAVEAKAAATKTAAVKPDLKVVEPKATPSLMSKAAEGEDDAAPKKKRSEKDPLAGLDKIADPVAKWEALSAKANLIPSAPYKMSGSFEPKTGLQHKVLGWGYVLTAQNDRLEVLFKDGVRILISNYKAP